MRQKKYVKIFNCTEFTSYRTIKHISYMIMCFMMFFANSIVLTFYYFSYRTFFFFKTKNAAIYKIAHTASYFSCFIHRCEIKTIRWKRANRLLLFDFFLNGIFHHSHIVHNKQKSLSFTLSHSFFHFPFQATHTHVHAICMT